MGSYGELATGVGVRSRSFSGCQPGKCHVEPGYRDLPVFSGTLLEALSDTEDDIMLTSYGRFFLNSSVGDFYGGLRRNKVKKFDGGKSNPIQGLLQYGKKMT